MSISKRNKEQLVKRDEVYEKQALPAAEKIVAHIIQALLAAGIDAETLKEHAPNIGTAMTALASMPPAIRAQVVATATAEIMAQIDAVPRQYRSYVIWERMSQAVHAVRKQS